MNLLTKMCALSIVVASSICGVCQSTDVANGESIKPDEESVKAHLIGKLPVMRFDFNRFPQLASVGDLPVEVKVDELGNVEFVGSDEIRIEDLEHVPAELKTLATSFLSQVDSLKAALHFKPFEVEGRPGRAEFTIDIPIRPLQDEAERHIPFPQIHDWNSVVIRLSRSGCFGACPSYSVEVHGDGTVLYTGGDSLPSRGSTAPPSRRTLWRKWWMRFVAQSFIR